MARWRQIACFIIAAFIFQLIHSSFLGSSFYFPFILSFSNFFPLRKWGQQNIVGIKTVTRTFSLLAFGFFFFPHFFVFFLVIHSTENSFILFLSRWTWKIDKVSLCRSMYYLLSFNYIIDVIPSLKNYRQYFSY